MKRELKIKLITALGLILAGVGGLLLNAAHLLAAEKQENFSWSGKIAAGRNIEIKGINGSIKAEPSSNGSVVVKALKQGNKNDPAEVKIEVVEHTGGVTICAVYPSKEGSHPNECKPGEGGRLGANNNDVKVEFSVGVPAGVNFVGRTVNGGITAKSLSANIEAFSVNGGINIDGGGTVLAKTVNGGINASLGSTSWSKPLKFQTVNGGVTVSLPAAVNAEVEAQTVNGAISTDFPLTVLGKFGPKKVQGTIGNGGSRLEMATVNGAVTLRKNP
jgi:DUF4097 and DUF4098 domain-containing protein YvlB